MDEITGPVTVLNGEWCIPVTYPNMFLEGDISTTWSTTVISDGRH